VAIYKRPTPPLSIRRINGRKKNKGLEIEQIYGHGSQWGPMSGESVQAARFCIQSVEKAVSGWGNIRDSNNRVTVRVTVSNHH
jgi:hypothetical protein